MSCSDGLLWFTSKSWGTKNSLSLVIKFYSSFNFVEIAFIRCVFKQCFHTLTYSQFSTLIVHLYFSSSLSICTFLKKVPKTGQLCPAFGASFAQESLCDIFRSVHTSPLAACRNAWGGKNSLRSNIMPPVSKHCSAARCASQRCPSALGGELPFAMNRRVE